MSPAVLLRPAFWLLALAIGASLGTPAYSGTRIRMVAANLTSGNGQDYDPGHGNRILQGLKPDIVMVQEFNYLGNTPADLRAWVDMNFGTSFSYVREPIPDQIPNGIVSRYPILASGAWNDANVSNRDFVWARIDIPGERDLWVISVHLLTTSSSNRNAEANQILNYIAAQGIPASDYVALGGDFNTDTRTESCINTFSRYFVTSGPWPVDQSGNGGTNRNRDKPYDWVLADADLHPLGSAVTLGANTFPSGLVFDSRVYTPLPSPVLAGDSGATNMQHMAVVRDFIIPSDAAPVVPVIYSASTASAFVGQSFTFQVAATNSPTSFSASGVPGGLTFNTSTGVLSGTPTATGSHLINLTASNAAGTGNGTLNLTVGTAGGGGGGGGGTILLSEDFAGMTQGTEASPSSTALTTFPPNFPECSRIYSAGGTAKLGSSSASGSLTTKTLDLSGSGGAFTISLKVKGWTTVEGDLVVTPTGLPAQTITYTNTRADGYLTKTLSFTGGTANSTIRIETTQKRAFIDDVVVSLASPPATPTLSAGGTLGSVDTVYGEASPVPASFTVAGADLTAGVLVVAPAGFELSQTPGGVSGYASSQTLVPASGTLAATTLHLRMSAGTIPGTYFGNVVCSSAGAADISVPVAPSAVARRPLVITALDRTKPFGAAFIAGTTAFASTGLVQGQTIDSVALAAADGADAYDPAGTYSIVPSNAAGVTFTASNYSISYQPGTLTVTATSFADWSQGLPDPSAGGDSDGDGNGNLLEYFMGLNPNAADGLPMRLQSTPGGTELTFDYRRNKAAVGVTAEVETSTDLSTVAAWTTADVLSDEPLEDLGAHELRRATLRVNPGETRKYVRLRVSQ